MSRRVFNYTLDPFVPYLVPSKANKTFGVSFLDMKNRFYPILGGLPLFFRKSRKDIGDKLLEFRLILLLIPSYHASLEQKIRVLFDKETGCYTLYPPVTLPLHPKSGFLHRYMTTRGPALTREFDSSVSVECKNNQGFLLWFYYFKYLDSSQLICDLVTYIIQWVLRLDYEFYLIHFHDLLDFHDALTFRGMSYSDLKSRLLVFPAVYEQVPF